MFQVQNFTQVTWVTLTHRCPEGKFWSWPTGSKLISFAPSGREKRNGAKIIAVTWLETKLFTKNYFA